MPEEKGSGWFQYVVDIVRQITTPVAAFVFLAAVLIHLGSVLANSSMPDPWRGWLLVFVLALVAAIVFALIVATLWFPQNLTFDKESHIVLLTIKRHEAYKVNNLVSDLIAASKNPGILEAMASEMNNSEEAPENQAEIDGDEPPKPEEDAA